MTRLVYEWTSADATTKKEFVSYPIAKEHQKLNGGSLETKYIPIIETTPIDPKVREKNLKAILEKRNQNK